MTLQQALSTALAQGLARIDAQMLLLHVLGRASHDRAWLITHDTDTCPAAAEQFGALCQRRRAGTPVAYLTGRKAFYGLDLQVDERVLDPRPDTETLVDWALEVLAHQPAPRVVDLGTGSGAIALALQQQRPDAQVLAVDASQDVLAVAQANATRLGLPGSSSTDTGWGWQAALMPSYPTRPILPPPTRTWPPSPTSPSRPWPAAPMAWTTCAASSRRPWPTWRPVAGCCWNTATTRPRPSPPCCSKPAWRRCKSRKDLAGIVRCSGGQRPTVK